MALLAQARALYFLGRNDQAPITRQFVYSRN
jgi:hypothetical protein